MISVSRYFNRNGMIFVRNELLIGFVSIHKCVLYYLFAFLPRMPNVAPFGLMMFGLITS